MFCGWCPTSCRSLEKTCSEDLRGYWFSKEAVLDMVYQDGGFGPFPQGDLDDIPEKFWELLALDPETEAKVREHVEAGGEVKWG